MKKTAKKKTEKYEVEKHFVTFFSPGTFVHETSEYPIDSWDTEKAVKKARTVVERYNSKPFGFQFSTRGRKHGELDSKIIKTSPMYYLGGKIETLADVERRNDPNEEILRSNMKNNNIKRIVINNNSWKSTHELKDKDVVLDVTI